MERIKHISIFASLVEDTIVTNPVWIDSDTAAPIEVDYGQDIEDLFNNVNWTVIKVDGVYIPKYKDTTFEEFGSDTPEVLETLKKTVNTTLNILTDTALLKLQ